VAQDKDQWLDLLNTIRVPQYQRFSRPVKQLSFFSRNSMHCGVELKMVEFLAWYLVFLLSGSGGLPPLKPIVVHEGENVRLRCAATGNPRPAVEWRKLDGSVIPFGSWQGIVETVVQYRLP
jgi:hypothetical protein